MVLVQTLSGSVGQRRAQRGGWKSKPSWSLVATEYRMILPPARRLMSERARSTVTEFAGSHAIYVSKPDAVARLMETAAQGATSRV